MNTVKQLKKKAGNPLGSMMRWLCLVMMFSVTLAGYAQNNRSVSGKVTDGNGEVIIGANVKLVGNNSVGTITDLNGKFKLNVPVTGTLEVSYIGYMTKRVSLGKSATYDVTLAEDSKALDEVVVVGYGTQKKATLTGAVSAVNSDELVLTKSQNAQNMLTGKVPGVRVIQKTSEPGELNNQFDIRGFGSPLVVVDGVPRGNLERMDPNEIESISVLKDASAAIYGVRAANGVVLITTKKGEKNKTKIEYNMYYGIQTPAEMLRPVGAADRMMLANEVGMRNLTDPKRTYTDEQIDAYRNGEKISTDWYDAVMRGSAPQQQHNVSISGGGDKMSFFINLGYMDQESFFKKDAINYNRYNLRSNLSVNITNNLKASLNINGILDKKERPQMSTWEIYKVLWRSVPDQSVYANDKPGYYKHPEGADIQNAVACIDPDASGRNTTRNRIFQSNMDLEYTVPFVQGLKLKGMFSYDNSTQDNTNLRKEYNEYLYNATDGTYTTYPRQSPTWMERYYGNGYTTLWQASVNYDHTFVEQHHVSALLLFEDSHTDNDNIKASREFAMSSFPYLFAGSAENQIGTSDANNLKEYASQALVGRFNYDYKGKYLAEFAFRYDGSSKFPSNSRWGFFPSTSLGWRISEEAFLRKALPFVQNLKLRASWGRMGDDSVADYQFITGYNYPNTAGASHDKTPTGYVFNGVYTNALGFRTLANPDITWYTVDTWDLGLDADLWNGLLGFSFDLFVRNRDGLMQNVASQLPGSFGATLPQQNLESDRTKGFELELRHRNHIGQVAYNVSGSVSLTRSMWTKKIQNPFGNSYDQWKNDKSGRYNDIWFGFGDNGRYGNWNDIAYDPVYPKSGSNGVLPGDYIYEDWNGDGVIDDEDKHPIATTLIKDGTDGTKFENKRNYPLMNFSLNIGANWKGLDVSLLFQGSAMSYIAYGEQLASPLQWNGNALDLFLDRWHPVDANAHPYDPSIQWTSGYYAYGGIAPDDNSRFQIQKGNYLRLKTAEIGYTLPKQWLASVGVKGLRIYMNAYNLFTITGVKGVDPEKPAEQYGYMYPLNRTYNFGASLTF